MKYTPEEVMQFVQEEDVKFIRLAFCNVYGKQHNVAIMPAELKRAFTYGIAFDASAVEGFGGEIRSDLLLHPDPSTLIQLPWRPEQGKVVRMFCDISYPDGRPFERDTRSILKRAVATAEAKGFRFAFGAEMEFYLFRELPSRAGGGTKRDRLPVFGPPRGCRQRRHLPRDGSHRGGAERALRQLFPQAAGGL